MEWLVNLRPDDSGQTLVRCCSPPASEHPQYEAPSLSSCTGNEMWNEMSRYNRRAASLVHLLFKTDQWRDCLRGSSPQAVCWFVFLSHQHERAVLGEKTVRVYLQCFFIVRLYRWCNILQWCPILTVLFLCYLALLCTGLCLKFFSSIISWTFYVTPAGLIWSVCLHSPFWSSCISWIFLPSPPCPQFVFLYSLHKSLSLSPPFTVYLHLSHLTLFCHLQLKQREMCLHHRRPPTTAAPRRPAWRKR